MGCDILIENILKGIVVSHAKNGIRLHQIQDEFMRHAGDLCSTIDAQELENCLCGINGLYCRSDTNSGHGIWYAGKPSAADKNAKLDIPRDGEQVVRRRSSNAFHARSNESVRSHGPANKNNNKINHNCSTSTKNNTSNGKLSAKSNDTSFRTSVHSDSARVNARQPNQYGNWQKPTNYNRGRSSAKFYDHELVGDDFLMSIATIDLSFRWTKKGSVIHCGLCVSGQTIRSAAKNLRNYSNIKIILNIGSVDLLHGRDFVDMREDFRRLMQICRERNIQVIITTLAPLANALNAEGLREKYNAFNDFLFRTYSRSHKVIEIHKCMIDFESQKTLFECYQAEPKYMSGSNRPHMLWNRIGRQRVLKEIKRRIGI